MTPIDVSKFERIRASADLPSPKGVALSIIQMAHREDVSMAGLARLVKTDPAFVGRLLKAANGLNAVGRRPVASVPDALLVLGLPAVSGLALGFSLVSGQGEGACRNFDYQRFWSESLACAIAMEAINHRVRGTTPEEAFCLGLVARIGELALATLFPSEYSELLAEFRVGRERLVALEQREFVMDHCELSAAMLADWGLPKLFFESVAYQENVEAASFPSGSRAEFLTKCLALARQLARVCLSPERERADLMQPLLDIGLGLALGQEDIAALGEAVAEQWQSWGKMLDLRARHVPTIAGLSKTSQLAPVYRGAAAGATQPRPAQRLRVLVVDDDPVMRALVRTVVVREGHEVFEARNGKEGLDRALDLQPHMMIVDWLMPELDGMALTRALRQTKAGRGIYVLVLTSLEDDERLIEAFENDVDDYLSKPLKQRVLAARLRAGQRVVRLRQEIECDREEIRHFAAELAVSNRRLQEAALTDSLTGLPNRRFAMDRLAEEWATSQRSKRPLSCLVIDLDEFKAINDTYGHDVGDMVLRQAAIALKLGLREQDVLCRMGGDEFLAICPGNSLEQMLICAERVRLAVQEGVVGSNGQLALKITVSIGAAVRQPSMENMDALIKRADQSLYLAKERGRNCVAAA
jgi:diguanylate cyclase (GGDEF)-like protein